MTASPSTPEFPPDRGGARRSGPRAGPAVLFVPLLLFVISIVWLATARPRRGVGPRPAPRVQIETVEGWTGRSPDGAGPGLAARLTRLHADPRRQAFESKALASRLGLVEGEPFRLELHALSLSDADDALALAGLEVHDDQGLALSPLPPHVPLPDDGVADPLAVLLQLPEELASGVTAGLVLWGRAPGAGARLVGCAPEAVALEPGTLAWRGVDETLASLERAPGPDVADEDEGDER